MDTSDIQLTVFLPAKRLAQAGLKEVHVGQNLIKLDLPHGLQPGDKLRLIGGASEFHPTLTGNLLLEFQAEGDDPVRNDPSLSLPLTQEETRDGCTRLLDLEDSTLEVKIPAGLKDGQAVRLRGAAKHLEPSNAGDLYLVAAIERTSANTHAWAKNLLGVLAPDDVEITIPVPFLIRLRVGWKLHKTRVVVTFGA